MNTEHNQFRSLVGWPGRVTSIEASIILGFPSHDVPVLVSKGLLRPLGRPRQNSTKYFATAELLELRHDVKWLARATDAVQERWRLKNRKNGNRASSRDGRNSRNSPPFEDPSRDLTTRPTQFAATL